MLAAAEQTGGTAILCGAFQDDVGETAYSGVRRRRGRWGRLPLVLERVHPTAALQEVDAFNGNLVFVPGEVAERLAGVDPTFTHHWGRLRLRTAGP